MSRKALINTAPNSVYRATAPFKFEPFKQKQLGSKSVRNVDDVEIQRLCSDRTLSLTRESKAGRETDPV